MILVVKAQIGKTGPVVTVRGRDAWALLELKAANDNGSTPIDHPGPRWSGYVHKLRKAGIIPPQEAILLDRSPHPRGY
jgi:hypothetical protein